MLGKFKNSNNARKSSWMMGLLVPAITVGIGLLGYQTYTWVTGESFSAFSFDIGRLWSSEKAVSVVVQPVNTKLLNNNEENLETLAIKEKLQNSIVTHTNYRQNDIIENVFEQNIVKNTSTVKRFNSSLNRINEVDINPLYDNGFNQKYAHQLRSENLISPTLVPHAGKFYVGVNFSPSFSYRVFNLNSNQLNGVIEDGNHLYTNGMTESKRNELDKAITSYSFGLDFGRQLNAKLSIYSGIHISGYGEQVQVCLVDRSNPNFTNAQFHDKTPEYTATESVDNYGVIPYTNRYKYLEIPFGIQYSIKEFDRAKVALDIGGYYQTLYQASALLYDFNTDYYYWFDDKDKSVLNKHGAGVSMGVSLVQIISDRIELTVNPHFKFNLNSTFSSSYCVKQNQYISGIRLGIRQQIL